MLAGRRIWGVRFRGLSTPAASVIKEHPGSAAALDTSKYSPPVGRYALDLENMLGNSTTDCGNLFHGRLSNVGTFDGHNMAPRYREQEPSTVSLHSSLDFGKSDSFESKESFLAFEIPIS